LLNNCNGSNNQTVDHKPSLGCEVKISLDKDAKKNNDLVTTRSNGGKNCDADDRGDSEVREGSLEAQYIENQDPTWSKGTEHGFGNAKRHVLLSHLFLSCFYFCFFHRLVSKLISSPWMFDKTCFL
jgi:tRNA wybutosine-synthesizing protein 3